MDEWTLPGVRIIALSVGKMDNNCYLVTCEHTGASVLVDAAAEPSRIEEMLKSVAPGSLDLIVTTHRHPDHWQALKDVAASTGAPTAAHRLDAPELPIAPDQLLEDGDVIEIGQLAIEVIHLRGHTPGSIALVLRDEHAVTHLLTGDSLFPGGVGKTWSSEDFKTLFHDVEQRIFRRFPDDTVVYPGHGSLTTLGDERPHLSEWWARGW